MGGRMFKEKIVPLKPEKAIIVQSDVINKIKQNFSELKIGIIIDTVFMIC